MWKIFVHLMAIIYLKSSKQPIQQNNLVLLRNFSEKISMIIARLILCAGQSSCTAVILSVPPVRALQGNKSDGVLLPQMAEWEFRVKHQSAEGKIANIIPLKYFEKFRFWDEVWDKKKNKKHCPNDLDTFYTYLSA